jgi:heme exporter protein A
MKPLLRFDAVTLARGGRMLFKRLDLTLGPGEALHVAGPNGSGKSSLLRLAAGLLWAAAGRVERTELALCDDALALDRELPLRKALLFWARLAGTTEKLDPAIEAMGLADLADVPVRLLSAGQARRATLARVAASAAPLWLLDEPLNGLDGDGVERLDALVAGHRTAGGAVVAGSHGALGGDWARLELAQ